MRRIGCDRSKAAVRAVFGVAMVALMAAAGCQGVDSGPSAAEVVAERSSHDRVLEFFDELDRREVACQDDLLQGMLLVSTGESPTDQHGRLTEARRLGIVEPAYNAGARESVSVEQASAAAARTVGSRDFAKWSGNATDWAKQAGLVPATAKAADRLSGGQLLAILGGLSDYLATKQSTTEAPASPSGGDAFDQFSATEQTKASPVAASKPVAAATPVRVIAADSSAPQPRPEPLPEMTLIHRQDAAALSATSAPASPSASAPTGASAEAVAPAVDTTAQQRPSTPLPTTKPLPIPKPTGNPWASGRPVGGK